MTTVGVAVRRQPGRPWARRADGWGGSVYSPDDTVARREPLTTLVPHVRRLVCAALLVGLEAVPGAFAHAQPMELTVEAPPALQGTARRVIDIDQAQLAQALNAAGLAVPPRAHVTLIPDDDPRAAATPRWIVGRAYGTGRIELFPSRIGSYPYQALESVVRHEIVHLSLNQRAGGRPLPRWFHEGVAVTVEGGWGAGGELRLLLAALERPALGDVTRLFGSGSQPETTSAYLLAAALVDDLRQRHGSALPGEIAALVADGVPFDAAFERRTGETVEQAAGRAWAGYRRLSRWFPVLTSPSAMWFLIMAVAAAAFIARLRRRAEQRRRWREQEGPDEDDDLGTLQP
jgi:hypothetical protein